MANHFGWNREALALEQQREGVERVRVRLLMDTELSAGKLQLIEIWTRPLLTSI